MEYGTTDFTVTGMRTIVVPRRTVSKYPSAVPSGEAARSASSCATVSMGSVGAADAAAGPSPNAAATIRIAVPSVNARWHARRR